MTSQVPFPVETSRVFAITRPDPNLLLQFFLWSLAGLVLFPVVFLPFLFRFLTLRYRFDEQGVSVRWGLLFRREINLTYARIQDIHLSRGLLERWLGLGTLSIQTASGSMGAEMTIQGLKDFAAVRDFLYGRMRGHGASPAEPARAEGAHPAVAAPPAASGEALRLLRRIHSDLVAVREALTRPGATGGETGGTDERDS